jgi:hypothetical protein
MAGDTHSGLEWQGIENAGKQLRGCLRIDRGIEIFGVTVALTFGAARRMIKLADGTRRQIGFWSDSR